MQAAQPRRSFGLRIYTDRGPWPSYIHHRQPATQRHQEDLHRNITTVSANTALPARLALRHLLTVGSLKCRRRATRRIPVTLTACFLFLLPRFRHFGSSTFISGCYRPLRQVLRGQPRAYTPHFCLSVLYLYRKLRGTSAVLQTQVSLSLFLLELCS